jgi:hypothetical protein
MRDIIRHQGGVVPLIVASVVFALRNTAYKYAVSGLPVMTVLAVMLLTAAAALCGCAVARGRQRRTRGQLSRIAVVGMIDPAIGYAAIGLGLRHGIRRAVQSPAARLAVAGRRRHRRPGSAPGGLGGGDGLGDSPGGRVPAV